MPLQPIKQSENSHLVSRHKMNSRVAHDTLQPDDLAGIAVLYGRKQRVSAGEIQACEGDVAER